MENKESCNCRTAAIVVLFHPEIDVLMRLLNRLQLEVDYVILIDNSDRSIKIDARNIEIPLTYFHNGNKGGIAGAQNHGIVYAQSLNIEYLLFLDQDSVPGDLFLSGLKHGYKSLESLGIKVASVGPRAISSATGQKYSAKIDKGSVISNYTRINQIISSGSLVRAEAFNSIGLFETELFIDLVDYEWCWRARAKGYAHFLIEGVHMNHMFGEKEVRLGGFRMNMPTTFRFYYQVRNYLWLVRRNYVPIYWKISNFVKLFLKAISLSLFSDRRLGYMRSGLRGVLDGLSKR